MVLLRSLLMLLVPGAFYFTALYLHLRAVVPATWQPLLDVFPYLAVASGLFFGWRFNRARVIWAILLIVLVERILTLSNPFGREFFLQVSAVLLPVNLTLFSRWTERGLLTVHGLQRLLFVLLQICGLSWLYIYHAEQVVVILNRPLMSVSFMGAAPFPQAATLVMILCLIGLLIRFCHKPEPLEGSFSWVLVAIITGLWQPEHFIFWTGVAAFLLTVAIVESSIKMAFNDELTGLPARRAMNEFLLRTGRRYTVAMVDVDHFKKINDIHGHDVGDQVLRMIATCLRRVSGGGRAYRYGGEEFVVIFQNKDLERSLPHLEELRETIARTEFFLRSRKRPKRKPEKPPKKNTGKESLQVTVSIGVASRDDKNVNTDQLFKTADQALYKAKKSGRNRVCT
jgi:diguanylate cyclase (GGDEF)-like protein